MSLEPSSFKSLFSRRALNLQSSIIRDILKLTANPEVISFAGGLPSDASFPILEVKAAFNKVLTEVPQSALQYSTTAGYKPLREWVANYKSRPGCTIDPDQVMIVSGSQQALDLIGKVFLEINDKIMVETPTYLGALQAFSLFDPTYVAVDSDDNGLIANNINKEAADGVKFLYTMPSFQNPTGCIMPDNRRIELVNKARELNLIVVEDDPYGELWFDQSPPPSLLSKMPERVIHMGSFSKILAPGLRLGFLIAPLEIINKLEQIKQATDLHTSTLSQYAIYEVIKDGFLDTHLPNVRKLYKAQAEFMLDALDKFMPKSVTWSDAHGGMFLWLTFPEIIDSKEILELAIAENVAFVPGSAFYANKAQKNVLRLSYVTVPKEKIYEGIERLSNIFKKYL